MVPLLREETEVCVSNEISNKDWCHNVCFTCDISTAVHSVTHQWSMDNKIPNGGISPDTRLDILEKNIKDLQEKNSK